MTKGNRILMDAVRYIRHYHRYPRMTEADHEAIELLIVLTSPEFDRINHGPFAHPTK